MLSKLDRIKNRVLDALGTETNEQNKKFEESFKNTSLFTRQTANFYTEDEPHVANWIRKKTPKSHDLLNYALSVFPFAKWILNYNITWFLGDLVAGITIGAVVVPQGMAYAILAGLPPQYGLYSSFMGVLTYWLFATSKDITIGPIAIMSVLVGMVVSEAKVTNPDVPGHVVASGLSLVTGIIIASIGLLRCGWIIDLIPHVSIAAFTTGSAISIFIGQIPGLLGIKGLGSNNAPYQLLIRIFKNFHKIQLDAAIGLSSLFLLYLIRSMCILAAKKFPSQEKRIFFLSTLRTVLVILLFTMISWLVNRTHRSKPLYSILSTIPSGFSAASVPVINKSIFKLIAGKVPVAIILLMIEHVAVAKIFGSINNYVISPSQEMVAIGVTNILGSFIGGFAATGSFSRTAIGSKAGVRTPFAGVITAIEVLLAILVLPSVFFYIPFSTLSAVIIHSVLDLVTTPSTLYHFWCVSPLEVPIFFTGVIVTIFSSIENGLYTTTCISFLILIIRFVKARGKFLGMVKTHMVTGDSVVGDQIQHFLPSDNNISDFITNSLGGASSRYLFPALDYSDGSNPEVKLQYPKPGIFIFRFSQDLNYLSASHYFNQLTSYIYANTRRTNQNFYVKQGDRPWNDFTQKKPSSNSSEKPTLRAIILDFSAVNYVDFTSIQQLVDVRNQFDLYASPDIVDWHFSNVNNCWTKRALVASGFGYPSNPSVNMHKWKPIFGIAQISNRDGSIQSDSNICKELLAESGNQSSTDCTSELEKINPRMAVVGGLKYPFFHADLMTAWLSANAEVPYDQEKV
ncbi:putative sulfate permease 2 [Erysiphe necator]|uniref:Putative sulfate permease 2 n=1 Tax=Uncinula necator TaxID=52586 RepID=A0A0B1PCP4_UNCNE|nr:putative sulfate permease 2 [Erysiphe necator]